MLAFTYITIFVVSLWGACLALHWNIHQTFSLLQASLALFLSINLLISLWEISLYHYRNVCLQLMTDRSNPFSTSRNNLLILRKPFPRTPCHPQCFSSTTFPFLKLFLSNIGQLSGAPTPSWIPATGKPKLQDIQAYLL